MGSSMIQHVNIIASSFGFYNFAVSALAQFLCEGIILHPQALDLMRLGVTAFERVLPVRRKMLVFAKGDSVGNSHGQV